MRLLVVEDNARMASLLQRGLTEEGYSVDMTGDGLEAMEWTATRAYDAVVLDVMLPGADGFEVCADMRRSGRWAPVLMLTARDEVDWRVRGLECGADDYVVKPFAFTELTARLRALVRRGARERPPTLTNGRVRIDPSGRRVWNGDHEVFLAPTQFDLLELLVRHPGEVFSRSRLLAEVWDIAADPRSNVVDQHIGSLRRRLQESTSWDDLETVRGIGYRLRPIPAAD
ncbi:MAG: two-component system, OmpR family, response regulator [Frankiales bacterium]|jgi:two-component system OmpR family response regulator|nr:two-component system, OmpR family, response regulator [Frankiales bacterium]MDX6209926.1 two-component system, OmpR family, response regulator [Frankiales bacterium]MDX6210971.1 two-component system, OmpR family, response regulator [Frankiales bacterium]MDX6223541.1 two-component system, OmpR family, response regulator [Frankiales bacterium]